MSIEISPMALLHAVSALCYAVLAALVLLRQQPSRTGLWLAGACGVTAVWASVAAIQSASPVTGMSGWLELVRSGAWYGFLLHLYRRTVQRHRHLTQFFVTVGLLAVVLIVAVPTVDLLSDRHAVSMWMVWIAVRLCIAVSALLLLENLYFNTPSDLRWHINLFCVALGLLFVYDLVLYSDAVLYRRVSIALVEGRAAAATMAVPLLGLAAARNPRWNINIQVSRSVAFHSATLVLSGIFLLGLAAAGEVFRGGGAEWGVVVEVALIFGGVLVIGMLVTSASARSRLRALLIDHFFSHRFDYRREWSRCIDTLSAPETFVALPVRAVRAAAEVVDSPAGALYVRDSDGGAFRWAGSRNMQAGLVPIAPDHPLIGGFRDGTWIVVLDQVANPGWRQDLPPAWLAVPLNHLGQLIGFVLLAPARAPFRLDREVFDLLRIIGREVASRVAEQRAAEVLAQAKDLHDYSKRFAFVIHDIKNVSGQLTMLLSNAEVHVDNPEFQRDMLNTLRASVGKIGRLLARLQPGQAAKSHALAVPLERLAVITAGLPAGRRASVVIEPDGMSAPVGMDADAFDAVIVHLVNNALEASGAQPVRIALRHEARSLTIDVVDSGPGMAPEFIRDNLFRPFVSTKQGGHGIGAYQARELLREAGGDLLVISRPNIGTTMRLLLPCAGPPSAPAPLSAADPPAGVSPAGVSPAGVSTATA